MFILNGSPLEFFLMLALGAGGQFSDVASLISPEDYYRSRNVALDAKQLRQLAANEPKDGKAQLQQLLALRVLAADPDKVRNDQAVLQLLRGIADTGRRVTSLNGASIPSGKRVAVKAEDSLQFGKTVLQVKVILKKRTAVQK